MKKIIIFGATGTLGAYLSLHFKELDYEVLAVGHRKDDNGFFSDYNIPYYSVDITQKDDFKKLPTKDIYAVLHFAGALPASMDGYDANLYISSIVQGTFNVLEFAKSIKVDRIVFPQTLFDINYLFGTKVPIPADSLRKIPVSGDHVVYVIAKNAAVDLIEHYYHKFGLKRFILRLSRVYLYHPNPYTYTDGKKTLISDRFFIYEAMAGKDIEVWGDPNRLLETICIKDFLQIVEKTLEAEIDGGIYNIGSGGSTLEERVKGIIKVFNPKGKQSRIIYKPEKRNSQQFVLDIRKTVNELKYEPRYNWVDYLNDFKKEMKLQRFSKLWGREEDFYEK